MEAPSMSTKNPRINVTFEEGTAGLLARLASHDHKPVASVVRELVLEALELREDYYLSQEAKKLDTKGAKTLNHEDAWK